MLLQYLNVIIAINVKLFVADKRRQACIWAYKCVLVCVFESALDCSLHFMFAMAYLRQHNNNNNNYNIYTYHTYSLTVKHNAFGQGYGWAGHCAYGKVVTANLCLKNNKETEITALVLQQSMGRILQNNNYKLHA